jgi:glyoxylase-like metal-dependent hydrolase (beta-lactamase superfamily II)
VDLATFLFASNYGEETRKKPLILLGGRGLEEFYKNLVRLYRWLSPVEYDLVLKSLPAGEWDLGGLSIQTSRSSHNPESIALRLREGKSVVFTGDTGFSKDLIALAAHADLLVSECSFPERKIRGHLNLAALQRIVKEAKPRQVILSHLYPEWDTFEGTLHTPLLLGFDGLDIDL